MGEKHKNGTMGQSTKEDMNDSDALEDTPAPQKVSKGSFLFWQRGARGGDAKQKAQQGEQNATKAKQNTKENENTLAIPQTFKEMCELNGAMTGSNLAYIRIVQQCFEKLVSAATKGEYELLEVETNIMALRMHKDVKGKIVLAEFKMCMLASLRALLPKSWSVQHERAWSTFWEAVEETLAANMHLPLKYEKAVEKAVSQMTREDKQQFGLNAFNRLFDKAPRAEDHFNTSNSRLSTLATNVIDLCVEFYSEPTRTVDVVTSIGLRHIMYNISVDYFEPFVESLVEELGCFIEDPIAVAGIEWVLTQIATIMIITINQGSNPLLRAVVANSAKAVRAALAPIPKKDRFAVSLGAASDIRQ